MKNSLLFLSLILCSCQSDRSGNQVQIESIIKVEPPRQELLSLNIDKIIPLVTTDESVFGDIYKIDIFGNNIYVHDQTFSRNLFAFDDNGNFHDKLQIGKGPHEIINVYATGWDNESKEIHIYDSGAQKIKFFDVNLNYKYAKIIGQKIVFQHFQRLYNRKWLLKANYSNHPRNDTTAFYIIMDSTFQKIEKKVLPFDLDWYGIHLQNPITSNNKDEVLFCSVFDNNLYTIVGHDSLQIKYKVDFGSYNLSEKELNLSVHEIINLYLEGKRKSFLDNVKESNLYVGFSYAFKKNIEFCIYYKDSQKVLVSEYVNNRNFIPGTLVDLTDNYFVVAAEPSDVIEFLDGSNDRPERFQNLKIKESDNPVLVYYALKKML